MTDQLSPQVLETIKQHATSPEAEKETTEAILQNGTGGSALLKIISAMGREGKLKSGFFHALTESTRTGKAGEFVPPTSSGKKRERKVKTPGESSGEAKERKPRGRKYDAPEPSDSSDPSVIVDWTRRNFGAFPAEPAKYWQGRDMSLKFHEALVANPMTREDLVAKSAELGITEAAIDRLIPWYQRIFPKFGWKIVKDESTGVLTIVALSAPDVTCKQRIAAEVEA